MVGSNVYGYEVAAVVLCCPEVSSGLVVAVPAGSDDLTPVS